MSDNDRFSDAPVSRRRFMQLSAATGAALSLPGNATASTQSEKYTAEYQYILNHTPEDYRAPTLVTFSGPAGLEAFESLGFGEEVHTTTTPQHAAYAQLTTAEAQQVTDLPEADSFQFSPGSNPFWRIGYYPLGVFPEPRRSVDFIGFEQLKDGLAELEDRYPDRINVRVVGQSPGHTNNLSDRPDPKDMIVVELTNDVQDREAFREKEKVFHSCSLHGLERAGAEAGARVVENVARGSEPDVIEDEAKIEPLLDEAVVLMGFTNPDGWTVRNPQYDSGWQTNGPGTGRPRIPAAPLYERGNAEVYDTNRQYPVVGMIDPTHFPAQPNDPKSDEEDTPSFVHEKVPDAKAFVDFFSQYDNLSYGSDLHGGPVFNEFVLGLISQDQFDTRQLHELYEMCLVINEVLTEALDEWQTAGDIRTSLLGDDQIDPILFGVTPTQAFDYSTIYDTINYTVSGAFLDWMAHPEPVGLDLTTLDFEMAFSHITGGNVYNPELLRMEVAGYRTAIRTITAFAVRNSDTPGTDEEFGTVTKSGGERVAYVTTGEPGSDDDVLRSTDDELVFEEDTDDGSGSGDESGVAKTAESVTLSEGVSEFTFDVGSSDVHSAGFHLHAEQAVADIEVVDPDGDVVASFDGVTEERAGGKCCGLPEFGTTDPEPGTWTVRVNNLEDVERNARFVHWTLAASGTNPDPRTAWPNGEGFEQREYDVTPFEFFEDYGEFIDDGGAVEAVTVADVAAGALLNDDGTPAYDHVVAIHDYGANDGAAYIGEGGATGYTPADHPKEGFVEPGYTDALDNFVDAGGNLVLTDTGVNLITELDNDLVNGNAISREDITISEFLVARFEQGDEEAKNLEHPLFGTEGDVRPIQNQLWKVQPLGYRPGFGDGIGQAPMFLPDEEALAAAGESATTTVAGRAQNQAETGEEGIAAASLTPDDETGTGVHLISSLLPTPTQVNLHPFGLQNYTATFLGYVLLTSALGWEQVRDTGDEVRRYGIGDEWDTSDVEHLGSSGGGGGGDGASVSATGDRDVGGSMSTATDTREVVVTVESVTTDADAVEVRDRFPEDWRFFGDYSDGEAVESGVVSFGEHSSDDLPGESFTYYVESSEGFESTGTAEFGPATVHVADADASDEFAGTDTVYVVGVDI